ncbi:hypothetical protein GCM10022207_23130 [Streptomyces lannensis]|uniref:Uncharacterized protein n=1 Tax=Streptomyces lannensis TaxID=766498 RepID=A0ABP7JY59_9ACTN
MATGFFDEAPSATALAAALSATGFFAAVAFFTTVLVTAASLAPDFFAADFFAVVAVTALFPSAADFFPSGPSGPPSSSPRPFLTAAFFGASGFPAAPAPTCFPEAGSLPAGLLPAAGFVPAVPEADFPPAVPAVDGFAVAFFAAAPRGATASAAAFPEAVLRAAGLPAAVRVPEVPAFSALRTFPTFPTDDFLVPDFTDTFPAPPVDAEAAACTARARPAPDFRPAGA